MADLVRILAIETASEACSVALFETDAGGPRLIAHDHRVLGRGHAEALVPMIGALPDRGKAQRILVSLGPGSFTGVRIGIATARALGFAWDAQVLGYPTLALVAAMALKHERAEGVTVCTNAGHGEWFVQNFGRDGAEDEVRSIAPDAAIEIARHSLIAGNRAEEFAAQHRDEVRALSILPDAGSAHALAPAQYCETLAPIYGRAPDARPQRSAFTALASKT